MKSNPSSGIRRLRQVICVATVVVLGSAMSGCGSGETSAPSPSGGAAVGWNSVVAAARAEGQLTVYSSQAGSDVLFKQEFEKAYPEIKVTVQRQASGTLLPQLDQEISAGVKSADVTFHAEHPWFKTHGEDGSLAPVQLSPDNKTAYGDYDGKFGIPILRFPYLLGYNTKLATPVTNIEDLVEKASADHITVALNKPESSTGMMNQYELWDKTYPGILKRLAALPHTIAVGTQPIAQSMAAGEAGYGVGFGPGIVPQLKEQGAPIEEVAPTGDGVAGVQLTVGVLAAAPHPNAAQVFTNWLMSKATQQMLVKRWSLMVGFQVPSGGMAFGDITIYDPSVWTKEKQESFQVKWDALFNG